MISIKVPDEGSKLAKPQSYIDNNITNYNLNSESSKLIEIMFPTDWVKVDSEACCQLVKKQFRISACTSRNDLTNYMTKELRTTSCHGKDFITIGEIHFLSKTCVLHRVHWEKEFSQSSNFDIPILSKFALHNIPDIIPFNDFKLSA